MKCDPSVVVRLWNHVFRVANDVQHLTGCVRHTTQQVVPEPCVHCVQSDTFGFVCALWFCSFSLSFPNSFPFFTLHSSLAYSLDPFILYCTSPLLSFPLLACAHLLIYSIAQLLPCLIACLLADLPVHLRACHLTYPLSHPFTSQPTNLPTFPPNLFCSSLHQTSPSLNLR